MNTFANQITTHVVMPERTAISVGTSKSAKKLASMMRRMASVLDYGTGLLRNAYYLRDQGYQVSILETELQQVRIKNMNLSGIHKNYATNEYIYEKFNAVLCSDVLNVIPFAEIRKQVLEQIFYVLEDDGLLFLEISDFQEETKAIQCEDGFLIGEQVYTFHKNFKWHEIIELLSANGFESVQNIATSESKVIVAKKVKNIATSEDSREEKVLTLTC